MNTNVHHHSRSRSIRLFLALATASIAGLPAMATSVGSPATQNLVAQKRQPAVPPRPSVQAPRSLEVSYYTGDPQAGGTLISTVTLNRPEQTVLPQAGRAGQPAPQGQRPARSTAAPQDRAPRQDLVLTNAPAGATFAVIQDDQGQAHTIDLSKPAAGTRGHAEGGKPNTQDAQKAKATQSAQDTQDTEDTDTQDQSGQSDQGAPPVR